MVSIMDTVNNEEDSYYYIEKKLKDDVRKLGAAAWPALASRAGLSNLEFFRLLKDQEGLGKKGILWHLR